MLIWFLSIFFISQTGNVNSILIYPHDPKYNTSDACEAAGAEFVKEGLAIAPTSKAYFHCDSYDINDLKKLFEKTGPSL